VPSEFKPQHPQFPEDYYHLRLSIFLENFILPVSNSGLLLAQWFWAKPEPGDHNQKSILVDSSFFLDGFEFRIPRLQSRCSTL
jgi:hypothetical protein